MPILTLDEAIIIRIMQPLCMQPGMLDLSVHIHIRGKKGSRMRRRWSSNRRDCFDIADRKLPQHDEDLHSKSLLPRPSGSDRSRRGSTNLSSWRRRKFSERKPTARVSAERCSQEIFRTLDSRRHVVPRRTDNEVTWLICRDLTVCLKAKMRTKSHDPQRHSANPAGKTSKPWLFDW